MEGCEPRERAAKHRSQVSERQEKIEPERASARAFGKVPGGLSETIEDYEDFQAKMHEALLPQDAVERQLFERVVLCAWRLRRVNRVEAAILRETASEWRRINYGDRLRFDEGEIFLHARRLDDLARLEAGLERSFERALALLEGRQEKRRLDAEINDDAGDIGTYYPGIGWERSTPLAGSDGLPSPHLSDYPEEIAERYRALFGDDGASANETDTDEPE